MQITARERLRLLAGGVGLLLGACGGNSGSGSSTVPRSTPTTPPPYRPATGLYRDTFRSHFSVGAAIQANQISNAGADIDIVVDQFNSVTAEYEMKADQIAPTEGIYDFTNADTIVDFAIANNMQVRGHALLWHQSTPNYFLEGTKTEIRAKLEAYIRTVVTHFKDRVKIWDVVNEVITDDANDTTSPYRDSNWYRAVGGPEYIDWAFNAARAADPDAKLFINEYNTERSEKRGRLISVVDDLLSRNIPVDGIGHQFHININTLAADALAAIDAVDNRFANLENHITELDVSVYADPNSCYNAQTGCAPDYGAALPDSILRSQAQLYRDIFNGLVRPSSVTSVSTWGVYDGKTWLDNFPIARTNYPLLFNRDFEAKSAFRAITDSTYII